MGPTISTDLYNYAFMLQPDFSVTVEAVKMGPFTDPAHPGKTESLLHRGAPPSGSGDAAAGVSCGHVYGMGLPGPEGYGACCDARWRQCRRRKTRGRRL